MEDEKQVEVALWRLAVLGPLMSARLNHGDIRAYLGEASERVHRLPDGREAKLSARTSEAWHYAYQRGGFEALKPKERSDHGQSRAVRPELEELLLRAKSRAPTALDPTPDQDDGARWQGNARRADALKRASTAEGGQSVVSTRTR